VQPIAPNLVPPLLAPPPAPRLLPAPPPIAAPVPTPARMQQWAPPVAAVHPEDWFWVSALHEFAPVIAGVGLAAGAIVGLAVGTPALGAAWGASLATGILGVSVALGKVVVPTLRSVLRGDGLGPRPLEDLAFLGQVLLPTAAVAVGSALAVGTGALAFGGLLGATAVFGVGRLIRKLRAS